MIQSEMENDLMNWEQIEGKWLQVKGKVKSQWGKLTDDDLATVAGKKDQLIGKVQERYGVQKENAEEQVNQWTSKMQPDDDEPAPPRDPKSTT
jgi:uncharacterized protein YjbJ (UPF0337 family)